MSIAYLLAGVLAVLVFLSVSGSFPNIGKRGRG